MTRFQPKAEENVNNNDLSDSVLSDSALIIIFMVLLTLDNILLTVFDGCIICQLLLVLWFP